MVVCEKKYFKALDEYGNIWKTFISNNSEGVISGKNVHDLNALNIINVSGMDPGSFILK